MNTQSNIQPINTHNKQFAKNPIGIFDSGIGGLTVTKAVVDLLPNESIIYFGDTAHLPYGDKSAQAIQNYSLKIADMLLSRNCKMLLIACNSISAVAYDVLQQHVAKHIPIVNVIDPTIQYLQQISQKNNYKNIGLVGTRQTVKSNIYENKIESLNQDMILHALATPLLVPLIEEGFVEHALIDLALEEYLSRNVFHSIEALILGCTHYPIIKKNIINFYAKYHKKVEIIDSSTIVAQTVKDLLYKNNLLNQTVKQIPSNNNNDDELTNKHFYISDYTDVFASIAEKFFGKDINLEYYPLWK